LTTLDVPPPGRPQVAAIVLAAGTGTRFGGGKQLAELEGRPLVQHAVDAAARAEVDEIIVVVGHLAEEVTAALRLPPDARVVENPEHSAGMSTSLRTGIGALGEDVTAAVILLGDQPTVSAEAIRTVVDAHLAKAAVATRARYETASGHPVVLDRRLWPTISELTGDVGARDVLAEADERVIEVEIPGDPPPDVDTQADHAALRSDRG
jgi:molybdenum cofactor cytidylyltransferase